MPDDNNRDALARLTEIIDDASFQAPSYSEEAARAVLAALPGLGYIHADQEEWGVEGDKPEPWTMDSFEYGIYSREDALAAAERVRTNWPVTDPTARVVRRQVGPWVVCDADAE